MSKTIKVKMNNPKKITNRIIDNRVRLFAAETWARYFKKYTPRDTGIMEETYSTGTRRNNKSLKDSVEKEPGKVTYTAPYAHFQWEGIVMVNKNGSTWAKQDEEKFYTNRKLNYSYPWAHSHWEEVAERNHKRDVAEEITAYLKRR